MTTFFLGRDEDPEETVPQLTMELNKTVTTPRALSNETVFVPSTAKSFSEEKKEETTVASSTVSNKTEDDHLSELDSASSGSHSVVISNPSMVMEILPSTTESSSSPPYIKVGPVGLPKRRLPTTLYITYVLYPKPADYQISLSSGLSIIMLCFISRCSFVR